ncbi:hypothetical protein BLNAU_17435 [Blattamonas nauphoetae]|uniref:Uncharacterized protein n=1 Tax=Blattamonas nauphoetae TaxID=2049346 RepID=A0ABQ9X796_9EUKA|nr:hypothetical protein BLNAU_17435 [Blattamonas nauphoetae]
MRGLLSLAIFTSYTGADSMHTLRVVSAPAGTTLCQKHIHDESVSCVCRFNDNIDTVESWRQPVDRRNRFILGSIRHRPSEQPDHFQIERKNYQIDENQVLVFRHLTDLKFGEKPNYSLLRQLLQREWAVHVPPTRIEHSPSNELDASPFSSFRASHNSRMELTLSHGRLLEIANPFGSNRRTTRDGENANAEERHSEAGKMQRSTSCDTHLKMEKDDETATSPKHHTTFHTFDLAHPLLRTPSLHTAGRPSSALSHLPSAQHIPLASQLLRLVRRLLTAPAVSEAEHVYA